MRLTVEVDRGRERLGRLTGFSEKIKLFGPVEVSATADERAARSAGNAESDPLRPCGHVPFGRYRMKDIQEMSVQLRDEYGTHALLFEPVSGEALHAESYGRLVLWLHGGRLGEDGRLRTTNGGLRVDNNMLSQILDFVNQGGEAELEVKALPLRFWERFFSRRRRPSRTHSWRPADDYEDQNGSRPDGGGFMGREESLKGQGGTFGGGGASGDWEAPGAEVLPTLPSGEQTEKEKSDSEGGGAVETATNY